MKKLSLNYKVYCKNPNWDESIRIASFHSEMDALRFAEDQAKLYKKRHYINDGTYVTFKDKKTIATFSINEHITF
jgi:hypothetical protein